MIRLDPQSRLRFPAFCLLGSEGLQVMQGVWIGRRQTRPESPMHRQLQQQRCCEYMHIFFSPPSCISHAVLPSRKRLRHETDHLSKNTGRHRNVTHYYYSQQ